MTDYDLTRVVSPVCLLDESAQSAALFTASHSSTLNPGDPLCVDGGAVLFHRLPAVWPRR